ncbi:MAG: PAS domain S-box protein [Tannerella sp.]|nr:PAS domain S-box protein [Tannerella sp.]
MKSTIGKYIINSMVFRLTMLIVVVAMCTYSGIEKDISLFIIFIILSVIMLSGVLSLHKRSIKKIEYMFDAIDNNDLTFQYATGLQPSEDKTINELINRIIRALLRTRIDTMKQEKFYEQIIDSVNIGIIVIDEDGYIIQKNNKAMQLLGLSVLTHIKQIRRINDKLATRLMNLQSDDKFKFTYETERGAVDIYVNISGTKLQNKTVFIVTLNDINNEMDDKELDSWIRLTRVMTHEIMNSITPITSISNTLLSKHNYTKDEIQNGLEVISKTGKGLMSFVESYRKFTHIPEPQPTLFYVKDFIERMMLLARHHKAYSNIKWQADIQPADLILYADENLISLVVINLLKNAEQAIGDKQENGLISVVASCNDSESIIIEVSNNGPAIPEEEAAHIFIPFFTTKKNGSGVGLSVARQIMRLSGGNITLKKEHQPDMTTFVLTFP